MDSDGFLKQLTINTGLAHRLLVDFIRQEVTRIGLRRAVIALSGGIDSAVVAYLSAEALGADNVIAIRMPYKTSSPESAEHAGLVIEELGLPHDTVDITAMVDPLLERFPDMSPIRRGNIMARQRMIVLFDQSAALNALVIGTGNKTEALLGYTTWYGDSAASLHPIGDLYKYQVRQLARALGVPEVIIEKPPSADLWPGQTDEGEMGLTYDLADQLLDLLVDRRFTPEEAIEAGFEHAFVERIWEMMRRTHYKRHLPIIPKLSQRTIGYDFLYLRDWGT